MYVQTPSPELETAKLDAVKSFSKLLTAEITLAQHGNGFFEPKYWCDYLIAKYECQASSNKFYVLVHEMSK
jgi:hypothetical protein